MTEQGTYSYRDGEYRRNGIVIDVLTELCELSAYAAGRPLDKDVASQVSTGCRDVYKRIVAFLLGTTEGV